MKKIDFRKDVAPHLLAVAVFFLVTLIFFSPIFFDNKTLDQHDIQQFRGSSKVITDYRATTGEEALWVPSMFSGMPAYLVSVQWSNGPVSFMKNVVSLFLPSPVNNIFIAFLCYYILLLAFRVRPYLAIAGAIAFGLSSYMIIGLGAGHNSRIAAIAFMPLIMAGIHLGITGKRILGFGLTTLGLALHLRENHLQMTYYLGLIVVGYGIVQLVWANREKKLKDVATNMLVLIPAALVAGGTFFGQFWAISEYKAYTIRGASDLSNPATGKDAKGLSKRFAFEYNDQIGEPMTLLIPNFYGGSSSHFFVEDQNSASYQALAASSDNQLANQLANYTTPYWGESGAPYYGGAIIVFLFVAGILLAERKWVWWALPLSVLSIVLSWGSNFSAFNYFMFDYFPGYNNFRSVTFTLIITLFLMPLLGMMGVEKLLTNGVNKEVRKKLLIAFAATGGLCLLVVIFAGMANYARDVEQQFPEWFARALHADRKSLLRGDAFRSLAFILPIFIILYFNLEKKFTEFGFCAVLAFLVTMDLSFVDKRSFGKEKFLRKSENVFFAENRADAAILTDTSYYRVYTLPTPWNEARTSYYHHSLGGYHGAKLRRYQELYDSCIIGETGKLARDLQSRRLDFESYRVLNMLNTKYIVYGPEANNVILNPGANGNAWFVKEVKKVSSANEELKVMRDVNTKTVAVIEESKFKVQDPQFDSAAFIVIKKFGPKDLKYESNSVTDGLAVFSEIYYPKGWHAFIDGKETEIMRANYVLRALSIPAGKHEIEFKFEPKPYVVGNKVTMASSWAVLIIVLGCFGWSLKKE